MINKVDLAVERFNSGFSCSQSVLSVFCEDFGVETELGFKIAGSFGGGMGHLGEACGAVTGAFMVLGLKYGQFNPEDKYAKALNYLFVKEFSYRFRKLNGSINCKELLGYDLSDEEQLKAARQTDVWETKCAKYVGDAVRLLEEMMDDDKFLNVK